MNYGGMGPFGCQDPSHYGLHLELNLHMTLIWKNDKETSWLRSLDKLLIGSYWTSTLFLQDYFELPQSVVGSSLVYGRNRTRHH